MLRAPLRLCQGMWYLIVIVIVNGWNSFLVTSWTEKTVVRWMIGRRASAGRGDFYANRRRAVWRCRFKIRLESL